MATYDIMGELVLKKVFTEARHEANININKFVDELTTVRKMFIDIFPEYHFDVDNKAMTIVNAQKKQNAVMDPDRVLVVFDSPTNINSCRIIMANVIKSVNEQLSIADYKRIGLRSLWGIKYPAIKDANSAIVENLINMYNNDFAIFGDYVSNVHMGFNAIVDGLKINYNISPVTYQDIEITNNVKINEKLEHMVLIDIDVYCDIIIDGESIKEFYKKGSILNEKMSNLFYKRFKGERG